MPDKAILEIKYKGFQPLKDFSELFLKLLTVYCI
jgi:hypothetical protein